MSDEVGRRHLPVGGPPDQHATVSSAASASAAAQFEIVAADAPAMRAGTVEWVPGFDRAAALRDGEGAGTYADFGGGGLFDRFRQRRRDLYDATSDDRTVCIDATDEAPWSWICQLVVTRRSGERHLSTGWLLSPRAVVTTARCVFDPASGWARNVEVIPGLDGSRRPHGSATTERFETVQGWIDGGEQACDYGCLFLDDDGFPGLGHFGLAALSAPQPSGVVVNSAGYPSDDPRGTQWFDAGRVYGASDRSLRAGAGFATTAGSPVWLRAFSEGRWQRLVCAMVGSVEGRSLRLGGAALDNLKRWRASASPASVGLSPAAPPPPGP